MKYWEIQPGGEVTEKSVDWPREPNYTKHLRPLFSQYGFDVFERVQVAHPLRGPEMGDFNCFPTDMIVDENGHAKRLAYNWRASWLYASSAFVRRQRLHTDAFVVVGPALLFDLPVIF